MERDFADSVFSLASKWRGGVRRGHTPGSAKTRFRPRRRGEVKEQKSNGDQGRRYRLASSTSLVVLVLFLFFELLVKLVEFVLPFLPFLPFLRSARRRSPSLRVAAS